MDVDGARPIRQRVDAFGFERSADFDYQAYGEFESNYIGTLRRRAQKWGKHMGEKEKISSSSKTKRYIKKGIPHDRRTAVWMSSSKAMKMMKRNPTLFEDSLDKELPERVSEQIELDIPRTFPDNTHFQKSSGQRSLVGALRNVLTAIAVNNEDIGYCQGLNYIVGSLLLVTKDDKKTFFLMEALIHRLLPAGYFSSDLRGCSLMMKVFESIVRKYMPMVATMMDSLRLEYSLYCTRWFVCCFVDCIPFETVLRVWDCLFIKGAKVLIYVAFALVKTYHSEVVACRQTEDVFAVFRKMTSDKNTLFCHSFMESVYEQSKVIKKRDLKKLKASSRSSA